MHSTDFSTASAEAIVAALGQRLDELRLSRNVTQAELAERAGVSRSTLTRLAEGRGVSLDSFVRIMQALGLADHLAALLPDPSIRPVERLRFEGNERKRASRKRKPTAPSGWRWGDEEDDS